jgi:hypothetical protein
LLTGITSVYAQRAPYVYIYSPTNNSAFPAPANLTIYVRALGNTNPVQTVEFFAGTSSLGIVTNGPGVLMTNVVPLYPLVWSNVLAGCYALKAVATDITGLSATSAVVNVCVIQMPDLPLAIRFGYPTNGQTYTAPANIGLHAQVVDSNLVQTVQYFSGTTSLGIVTNKTGMILTNWTSSNPFYLLWSNVPPGSYTLTAVAADSAGISATSAPVNVTVLPPPPPHPSVYLYSPTNNSKYLAPASLTIYARAVESGGAISNVQFYAGSVSLGIVSSNSQVVVSNVSTAPLFPLAWSNVVAGNYALKAVATDFNGISATSQVVNISVITNRPPPSLAVGFLYPTNGQTYAAPANVGLRTWVVDSNVVQTVQYFAGATSIGTVSNTAGVLLTNSTSGNPFFLLWSNVPAGTYALTAVAADSGGLTATSAPVNIAVLAPAPRTNRPPEVRITSPPNAAIFKSPINLPIYAYAHDADGSVTAVEFFANTNSLGLGSLVPRGTNTSTSSYYTNLFFLVWSNVPPGQYALTASATDNSNAVAVSLPVNVTIQPPTPPPTNHYPIVSIAAIDPIAIEGTNCWVWSGLTNYPSTWTNWTGGTRVPVTNCGPKNATFSLYRYGDTNNPLTVGYRIGGTASNGVDYVALPGVATIPSGQRQAFISVVPLDDGPPDADTTVVLTLLPSTNSPLSYLLSSRTNAAAVIIDLPSATASSAVMPDKTFHVNAAGPNGAWFHIEYSTNLRTWTPICTNQVINGSIDFIDPDAATSAARFYRAIPETSPPQ